jgi:hypothetical protein
VELESWLAGVAHALSAGAAGSQFVLGRRSYLSCSLTVERPSPDVACLYVRITNTSSRVKRLGPVFLLAGPVAENPVTTFNRIAGTDPATACCAVDFEYHDLGPRTDPDEPRRRMIPLSFFTEENDDIGDETLASPAPSTCPPSPPAER